MFARLAALVLSLVLLLPGFAQAAVACATGGVVRCCCEHAEAPDGQASAGNVDACGCEIKQGTVLPAREQVGCVAPLALAVSPFAVRVAPPLPLDEPVVAPVPPGLGARAPPVPIFLLNRALLV